MMQFDNQGITGSDISKWQGYPPLFSVVNFSKMRAYGFSYVIMKAGQRNYADHAFKYNWPAAKGILPRASYWYYDNSLSPIAQADFYWQIIRDDLEGICWLDLEDQMPGSYRGWRNWYDFLETFKILSGLPNARIGIYTAWSYWVDAMKSASVASREYFHPYPLWFASYFDNPLAPNLARIDIPDPWDDEDCLMVQTGTPVIGLAAGVHSLEIDLNIFNGGKEKFEAFIGMRKSDVSISIRSI